MSRKERGKRAPAPFLSLSLSPSSRRRASSFFFFLVEWASERWCVCGGGGLMEKSIFHPDTELVVVAEVNADAERREAERNKGTRSKRKKKKKRESGKKTEGGEEEKEKSRLSLDNPPPSSLSLSTLPPRSTLPTLQSSSPTSLLPPPSDLVHLGRLH